MYMHDYMHAICRWNGMKKTRCHESHKSCRKSKSDNGGKQRPLDILIYMYQRWDQVPRRSKSVFTGHIENFLILYWVSYQSLSHSCDRDLDYGSYRLPNLDIGLMVGVTGQQGMLTPSWHLKLPLIYSDVRVRIAFPLGLRTSITVCYQYHFIWDMYCLCMIFYYVVHIMEANIFVSILYVHIASKAIYISM
jgi:hypothetical protein